MDCKRENVGNAIPDIAGVGIILAFAILAGLSLVFAGTGYCVALQARWKHFDGSDDQNLDNNTNIKRTQFSSLQRLDLMEKILGSISEVQLFNGIALLIAAMVQRNSLSLYRFHVVYDTVNFTAVSFTASMFVVRISRKVRQGIGEDALRIKTPPESSQLRRLQRMRFLTSTSVWIIVFNVLYLIYAVLFGIALGKWDVDKFGYCYRDRGIARPNQPHPEADHGYLGITCLYMFLLPFLSGFGIPHLSSGTRFAAAFQLEKEFDLVCLPLAQFLLHLYMVWAIRSANRIHLQGESEDTWGFGQVVALIQILPILKGCARDCMDYWIEIEQWNKENGEGGRTQTQEASSDGIVAREGCDLESGR